MHRIAIISPRYPWYPGGLERVVGEVAKRLKNDFEIEIFCTDPSNKYVGEHIWEDMPTHVFKGYTSAYHFSPQLYNALNHADFDLIHAHGFTTFIHLAAALTKKGKPLIFNPHFHPVGSELSYSLLRNVYDPIIGRIIFNKTDKIICNSDVERQLLQNKFMINNEIVVIYNGVDVQQIRKKEPFNFNGKLILYVGRLERYKNIHLIVEAMRYLPEDYHLYIIGDGSYKFKLKELINKLSLEKRIKMLGIVSDDDVYRWMRTCSLFVHLSEIESFGMTCIEALAAGKPVVVNNDNFGLTETANLFPECIFSIDLKKKPGKELADFIENKSRVKINQKLNYFDWNNIASMFGEVYEKALEEYKLMMK